jgi:hypothetical protein
MVDFESYFRYGPAVASVGELNPQSDYTDCECRTCRGNDALQTLFRTRYDNATGLEEHWDDEQYMLCPPRVLGYILREKQWAQLQVTLLKDIPMDGNENAFNSKLQLAGEKSGAAIKKLLMNLVKNHGSTEANSGSDNVQMDDIVVNKGKGLVILLYGCEHPSSKQVYSANIVQDRLAWAKLLQQKQSRLLHGSRCFL